MFFMRLAAEALTIKAESEGLTAENTTERLPPSPVPEDTSPNFLRILLAGEDANTVQKCSGLLTWNPSSDDGCPRRANSLSLPRQRDTYRPRRSTMINLDMANRNFRPKPYEVEKGTGSGSAHNCNKPHHFPNALFTMSPGSSRSRSADSGVDESFDVPNLGVHPHLLQQSSPNAHAPVVIVSPPEETVGTMLPNAAGPTSILHSVLSGHPVGPNLQLFIHKPQPAINRMDPLTRQRSQSFANGVANKPQIGSHYGDSLQDIPQSMLAQLVLSDNSPTPANSDISSTSSTPLPYDTPVQLAKKNMYPVCSRVTEWLKEIGDLVTSHSQSMSPEQMEMGLHKIWHRLLIISMIQHNFHFTVSPVHAFGPTSSSLSLSAASQPTAAFTQDLLELIQEGYQLDLDERAFELIRMSILSQFCHTSEPYNEVITKLSEHLANLETYSRVLVLINKLYRFESDLVRQLFCSHLPQHVLVESTILSLRN